MTSAELLEKAMECNFFHKGQKLPTQLTGDCDGFYWFWWDHLLCEHVGRFYPTTTFWKESMKVVAMRFSDMDFPKQPTGRYWNMLASKIGDKTSVTYHGCHSALSLNPISPYSSFQSSAASHSHRVIWGVSRHCRCLGATASLAVAWFECGSSENNDQGSFRAY